MEKDLPTIKVMSAGAVESMVRAIGAEFERASGHRLDLNFGTAGALRERVGKGEATDLLILPQSAIAAMDKDGLFAPGSVTDLGRTITGIAVREGAPAPDMSTAEAFERVLINAKSVSYTDPKAGGSSGNFFAGMLQKRGIAEEINKKAVLGKRGYEVAQAVADGRAEIGTTFISELMTVPGIRVVGPLPGEWYNANTYTAAMPKAAAAREAAQAFIRALTAPASRGRWTAAGLEPAFA
jgi:molybdate transport system substrate-binding protein